MQTLLRALVSTLVYVMVPCIVVAQDAPPPTELGTISVTGATVSIPASMAGAFAGHLTAIRSPYMCSPENPCYKSDLTPAQVCTILKNNQPKDKYGNTCQTNTYPPAPGIPSANGNMFNGNGCGAGIWSNVFAYIGLRVKYGLLYSGNLDEPIAGNPGIDFSGNCMRHDSCYTSPRSKNWCDNQFQNGFYTNPNTRSGICDKLSGTAWNHCMDFAMDYVGAVAYAANGAYSQDQAQLTCAEWGQAMKDNGCK